jgi:serine/threonine protein kinase/tetratricopeptide (TPR) repeat protein
MESPMTEMSTAEAVFFAAAALSASDRAAYLTRACTGNDSLRHRVERMLAARREIGDFLESPPLAPPDGATGTFGAPGGGGTSPMADLHGADGSPAAEPTADFPDKDERVGAVLAGKYNLIEEIGEGAMGSVYLAQQTEPIKRLVAVKVIKAGMDSKAVLARFDAERQALALMDHPNIARVFDAGSTSDGRPFFVMELVKGVPITQFCDARKLAPRERLELFVPVCQAIQHAHHKGIIHRDIKPRNVLVALYDDNPVPKVIDFGVAKATSQPLTEQTLNTGFGTVVGTPEYMSPKQATFNNLDIDTRSDVYALGVLLYELLTGSPPVSRKTLEQAGLLEILRMVREEEPSRPSTKLSTVEALPTVAANRGMEPRKLTGLLRNELDWIVMKALEKDRSRRYETANGFAADVLRYLSGEPVQAVPPSVGYRLRKFLTKNRGMVIGVAAVLLVLVIGVVGTAWGLLRAEQARTAVTEQRLLAEQQEAARLHAEGEVRRRQELELQRLLRNRDAVSALLSQVKTTLHEGNSAPADEALAQAEKRISEGGADELKERLHKLRKDWKMLHELESIDNARWRSESGKLGKVQDFLLRWATAFSDYQIYAGAPYLEEAARRINSSVIRERLLISLETYFLYSGRHPELGAILSRADPDDFRNECRGKGYSQAVKTWRSLGKPVPQSQPVWFAIGNGEAPQVSRESRKQLLLGTLRSRPNYFPILMELGKLEGSQKDLFQETLLNDPFRIGKKKLLGEQTEKEAGLRAAGWYRAALSLQPTNHVVWHNLGCSLHWYGDIADAISCFQEAIRFDPKAPLTHLALVVMYMEQQSFQEAISYLRKFVQLDPEYVKFPYVHVMSICPCHVGGVVTAGRRYCRCSRGIHRRYPSRFPDWYDQSSHAFHAARNCSPAA